MTAKAPVLLASKSGTVPELMSWGCWSAGPLVINTRAETVAVKALFRENVAVRQCAVPSTVFLSGMRRNKNFSSRCPKNRHYTWPDTAGQPPPLYDSDHSCQSLYVDSSGSGRLSPGSMRKVPL